jgi:hypothetical protein
MSGKHTNRCFRTYRQEELAQGRRSCGGRRLDHRCPVEPCGQVIDLSWAMGVPCLFQPGIPATILFGRHGANSRCVASSKGRDT